MLSALTASYDILLRQIKGIDSPTVCKVDVNDA